MINTQSSSYAGAKDACAVAGRTFGGIWCDTSLLFLRSQESSSQSWLYSVHYSTETAPCSINEKWDCGIVNHSPYAEIRGIPVAAIGIAGYLLIGVLALLRRRGLLLAAALVGMAFALYLTNIEARVLGVWCLYCVISQGIIAVVTLLAIGWVVWRASRERKRDPASNQPRVTYVRLDLARLHLIDVAPYPRSPGSIERIRG